MPSPSSQQNGRKRAEIVQELRRLTSCSSFAALPPVLPFGLPSLDSCLSQGGLPLGAVHEIVPATEADSIAALGFAAALLGRLPCRGPVIFIMRRDSELAAGHLSGHGLNSLGLDPARLIVVDTYDDKQTLWAMEEALRSGVPAAVAGLAGAKLDLLAGQRLHLAAGDSGTPLLLLRPFGLPAANVAATRWRIGAALSARDRFGLATHWRWHARLERCRNGRPGEWLVEFDHAAYRFGLPAAMAHPALSRRAGPQSFVTHTG